MNKRMIYIVSVFLFFALVFSACSDNTPQNETQPSGDADVVIKLDAFNYGYSIEEITIKKGQSVRIEMNVTQGTHDWVIDEFDAATDIVSSGSMASVEFVADTQGVFEYYCSVSNHRARGMVGTLIVE